MTNVNFDGARFAKEMIPKAVSLSEGYKKAYLEACKVREFFGAFIKLCCDNG